MSLTPRLDAAEQQSQDADNKVDNIDAGGIWKVGDVKQSFLDPIQFQNEHDSTWVLCDGQDVTGSDYAAITGNTSVPDIRGRFLRARDHGAGVNPDGDLAPGTNQSQATAANGLSASTTGTTDNPGNHTHQYNELPVTGGGGVQFNPGETGDPQSTATTGAGAHTHNLIASTVLSSTDNETRPECTTLNMYIKINRTVNP